MPPNLRGPELPPTSPLASPLSPHRMSSAFPDADHELSGAEEIAGRRRASSSFKVLTSGAGLVSNSIFTRGAPSPTVSPYKPPPRVGGLYSTSRSPAATRHFPNLHSSSAPSTPSESNSSPARRTSGSGRKASGGRKTSIEGEVKENAAPAASPASPSFELDMAKQLSRISLGDKSAGSPSPFRQPGASLGTKATPVVGSGMGLGRPPAHSPFDRRFTGSTAAPPQSSPTTSTPPHPTSAQRFHDTSPSRAPLANTTHESDGGETETEGVRPLAGGTTLSGKSVTWAANEEVLEFEVDEGLSAEGSSILSGGSTISEQSFEGEDDDGGSILVFDDGSLIDHGDDDDTESSISVADEVMLMVDGALEEINSPALHSTSQRAVPRPVSTSHESPFSPSTISAYLSASASPALSEQPFDADGAASESSYDDPEDPTEADKIALARAHVLERSKVAQPFKPTLQNRRPNTSGAPHTFLPTTLPAPQSTVRQVIAPHSAPPPSTGYLVARSTIHNDSSKYALPQLSENSPFLGFGMDEITSSVSPPTHYSRFPAPAIEATLPLTPRSQRSSVASVQSIPLSPTLALDRSASILSRHASILDSNTASLRGSPLASGGSPRFGMGSVSGSIRGPSKLAAGRARLEESTRERSRFEEEDSPPRAPSKATLISPSKGSQQPRAIAARPPLNSNSSSSVAASSLASTSTSTLTVMESALDRISKGNVNGTGPPRRRRSLSTGDARISKASDPVKAVTDARFSYLGPTVEENSFGLELEDDMDSIFRVNGKYREHKMVYATDGVTPAIASVGDVITSKAWKKKRASDVYGTSFGGRDQQVRESGKIFLNGITISFTELPIPKEPTMVSCVLTSVRDGFSLDLGLHRLATEMRIMGSVSLDLFTEDNKEFKIEIRLDSQAAANRHLLPVSEPTPSIKKKRSIAKLWGSMSPTKKKALPTSAPTLLLAYLPADGSKTLATAQCDTSHQSKLKHVTVVVPLTSPNAAIPSFLNSSVGKLAKGTLSFKMFNLRAIPGIDYRAMPQNFEVFEKGFHAAVLANTIVKSGVLTQVGGDCRTARRRLMTLKPPRLIPINEVTKTAFVEYNLSLAIALTDLNAPLPPAKSGRPTSMIYDDEAFQIVESRSFKIEFQDGTEIRLAADDERSKQEWIKVLSEHLGRASEPIPEWATALINSQAAKKKR